MGLNDELLFDIDKLISSETDEISYTQIVAAYAKKKAEFEAKVQAQLRRVDDKEAEGRRKLQGHWNTLALLEVLENLERVRDTIGKHRVAMLAEIDRRLASVLRHLCPSASSRDREANARPAAEGENDSAAAEKSEVGGDETRRHKVDDEEADQDELEAGRGERNSRGRRERRRDVD